MSTEYKLIECHCSCYESNSLSNFIKEIKKNLSDGWELRGDLYYNRSHLIQVLIKNNKTIQNRVIDYIVIKMEGLHGSDDWRPVGKERIPKFNNLVNKYLSDKWELYGNIVVGDNGESWRPDIYQALIKYSPIEVEDLLDF